MDFNADFCSKGREPASPHYILFYQTSSRRLRRRPTSIAVAFRVIMQAPQGSQRSMQRRSPVGEPGPPPIPSMSSTGSVTSLQSEPWPPSASVSGRSPTYKRQNVSWQPSPSGFAQPQAQAALSSRPALYLLGKIKAC